MSRLKYGLIFSLILCVLVALPLFAQSDDAEDCDIDLSEIAMMLIQAQDAAGSGDNATALSILDDAEAEIAALRAACGDVLDTFETYTTEDGDYRFSYPAAWVFTRQDQQTFLMGTSEAAIELLDTTEPVFESGMQGVALLLGNARQVGGDSGDDLAGVADAYEANIESVGYTLSDRTTTEVNGNPAVYLYFDGEAFTSILIVVDLPAQDTFAVFVGSSAPDEYDTFEPVLQSIVESLGAVPITLSQTFTFSDGLLAFDYPEDWVIGQEESFGGFNSAFLGTSMDVINEVGENPTPTISVDEQVLLVLSGEPQDIGDFESENLDDLGNYFAAEGLTDDFTLSIAEDAQYGDAAALEFAITGGGIAGNLTIVELEPEATYAVFVLLSSSDNTSESASLLEAIIASVRFPPSSDPLGLDEEAAAPTSEATEIPDADVELGETLEEDFFSFDYPAEWVIDDDQYSIFVDSMDGLSADIALGTSLAAIDLLSVSENPTYEAGQVGMNLFIGVADSLLSGAESDTVDSILSTFADEVPDPFEVSVFEIEDTQGEVVFGDDENVVASIYVIEVEPGLFAAFAAAGAPSEQAYLRALTAAMADSFTYDAEAVTAEIDRLIETGQDDPNEPVPTATTATSPPTSTVVTDEVEDEPRPTPTVTLAVTEAVEEEATPEVELDATFEEIFFSFDYPADWIIDEDDFVVESETPEANVYLGTSTQAIESVVRFGDVLPEAGEIGINVFIGTGDEFSSSSPDVTASSIIDSLEEFLATGSSLTVLDRVDDGDRGVLVIGNVDQVAVIRITQLDENVFAGIIGVTVAEDEATIRAIVDGIEGSLTYDADAVTTAAADLEDAAAEPTAADVEAEVEVVTEVAPTPTP